jgi:hypothetical protein
VRCKLAGWLATDHSQKLWWDSKPLVWEECPSARVGTCREIDSRSVRLDISACSFIKLVVHAPTKCSRNEHQQVTFECQCLEHLRTSYQPLWLRVGGARRY